MAEQRSTQCGRVQRQPQLGAGRRGSPGRGRAARPRGGCACAACAGARRGAPRPAPTGRGAASHTRSDSTRSPGPARSAATSGASSASAKARVLLAGSSSADQPPADEVGEGGDPAAGAPAVLGGLPGLPGAVGQARPRHRRARMPMRGSGHAVGQPAPAGRRARRRQRPGSTRASSRVARRTADTGERRRVGGDVDRGGRPLLGAARAPPGPAAVRPAARSPSASTTGGRRPRPGRASSSRSERGAQDRRRAVPGTGTAPGAG